MCNQDIRNPDESASQPDLPAIAPRPAPVLVGWDGGDYIPNGPVAPEDSYGQFLLDYQRRIEAIQESRESGGIHLP